MPSQEDPRQATATSNLNLSQAEALNNAIIVPSPLGLTSDTHQKRAGIHDLPEGDGKQEHMPNAHIYDHVHDLRPIPGSGAVRGCLLHPRRGGCWLLCPPSNMSKALFSIL